MPASYKENEYSVCDSELQDVVGVYTADNGQGVFLRHLFPCTPMANIASQPSLDLLPAARGHRP